MKAVLVLLALLIAAPVHADIVLRWQSTSTNHDGFTVEKRDQGETNWALISKVGKASLTHTDPSPVPWGRCYRVKAFNTAGVGNPSNEACVASTVPNGAVTNLTVENDGK